MTAKHSRIQPPPRRPGWRWAALGVVVLVALGAGAFWWLSEAQDTPGGRPRLVLDREVVDLGNLPFEKPARVVFTLTNAGNSSLQLDGVPRVQLLKGC